MNTSVLGEAHVFAAECIPTNTTLIGPLQPIIDEISGALGGVLFGVVILVLIILILGAIVTVMSSKSSQLIKAIVLVVGIPLVGIVLVAAYSGLVTALNNTC